MFCNFYQYLVIFLGLILLTLTGFLAQKIARKKIEIVVEDNIVSYDGVSIGIKDLKNIKINKSGIGISAIEFNLKSGEKKVLHMPNLKGNAEKGIAFINKALPAIEKIEPEDLLE